MKQFSKRIKNRHCYLFALLVNLALFFWQLIDLNNTAEFSRQATAKRLEINLGLLQKAIESQSLALGKSPLVSDREPSQRARWQNRQLHVPLSALDGLMLRPFNQWEFTLRDEACDLFAITRDQRAEVNKALKATLAEVIRVETANSKLIEDEEGSQYYEVEPYPERAIELHSDLQEALTNIVGANLATILSAKSDCLFAKMGRMRQQVYIEERQKDEFVLVHRMFDPDDEEIGSLIAPFNREIAFLRFAHLLQSAE